MLQRWQQLAFLHWRIDAAALRPVVPAPLQIDTFEGSAWIALVPFTIPYSRVPGLGLPLLPAFHELNVRTYVVHPRHGAGVWFFSLEAASRLAVYGARAGYALPYRFAEMELADGSAGIRYASRRLSDGALFRGGYRPAGDVFRATPGTLEHFLAERYVLFARRGPVLLRGRVHHEPYPLQVAEAEVERETLCAAAGLPPVQGPPLAHYVDCLDVRIDAPRLAL